MIQLRQVKISEINNFIEKSKNCIGPKTPQFALSMLFFYQPSSHLWKCHYINNYIKEMISLISVSWECTVEVWRNYMCFTLWTLHNCGAFLNDWYQFYIFKLCCLPKIAFSLIKWVITCRNGPEEQNCSFPQLIFFQHSALLLWSACI